MAGLDHRFWRRKKGGLGMSMCKGCVGLWMRLRLTEVERDVGGFGSSWYRAKELSDFSRVKMIRLDQPIASIRVCKFSHFPIFHFDAHDSHIQINLIFLLNAKSAGGRIGHFNDCELPMLGHESH